jgi:hypothetical protein
LRWEWFYKAKNLYRKDAKYAKKQNTSLTFLPLVFLCALCVFAVRMLLFFYDS